MRPADDTLVTCAWPGHRPDTPATSHGVPPRAMGQQRLMPAAGSRPVSR